MDTNCSAMVELSTSDFLIISLTINLFVSIIACPIIVWASYKLWIGRYNTLFNKNMKVIVQTHLAGFGIHCFGRIILHLLDLHNYSLPDPCDMVPNIYRCFIFRLMYNSGMWITGCTAFSLIFERFLATIRRNSYENSSILAGVILAILQCLIAAVPLYFVYSGTHFTNVYMPYCSVIKTEHPEIAKINSTILILAQFVARILFSVIFYLNSNFRVKMMQSTLSTKYQIEQNKNSTQCLKLFANISTVVVLGNHSLFLLLLDYAKNIPYTHYLAYMEFNNVFPIYAIISVFLMVWKIKSFKIKIASEIVTSIQLSPNLYRVRLREQIGAVSTECVSYSRP